MGPKQWMSRTPGAASRTEGDVPRWVLWFQNVARPAIAVIILVMCAPGEHHLAVMAGWSQWLAWGMPSCLVFYTAVAAIVATKRAKGAPGKRTAVAGAVLALGLAMSAQPVSHMFILGQWTGDPTTLVWVVSCVPPLVAGHLWHLAASPSQLSALVRDVRAIVPVRDTDDVPEPVSLIWDKTWDVVPATVPETVPVVPVPDTRDGTDPQDAVPAVRSVRTGSASSIALNALALNPGITDVDLRDIVLNHLPDAKADTIRKAVYRARRAA